MHETYPFIHSLIHLMTVVEFLLYQELEIEKHLVPHEEEEEMGTSNIPRDHRINAQILTLFSNTPHNLVSSDSSRPASPALALTMCDS